MPDSFTTSGSGRAEARPDWAREVRRRLASLKLTPAREAEIVEELSQHLDDRRRELLAGGATPEEATSARRIQSGRHPGDRDGVAAASACAIANHTGSACRTLTGGAPTESPLRRARSLEAALVHGRRRRHIGARDWRHDGDLRRGVWCAVEAASLRPARPVGCGLPSDAWMGIRLKGAPKRGDLLHVSRQLPGLRRHRLMERRASVHRTERQRGDGKGVTDHRWTAVAFASSPAARRTRSQGGRRSGRAEPRRSDVWLLAAHIRRGAGHHRAVSHD